MKAKNITTGVDPSRIQDKLPAFFISWRFKGEQFYRFEAVKSSIDVVKRGLMKDPGLYTKFYGGP